jgi:hypothetical protein
MIGTMGEGDTMTEHRSWNDPREAENLRREFGAQYDGRRYAPLQGAGLDRLVLLDAPPDDCLGCDCGDCPGCWARDRYADEKPDGWDGP